PVAAARCQVQNLDVEHVAVDALPAEQVPRHRTAEEFETTLRVVNIPQAEQQVHYEGERLRAETTMPRLRHLDARFGQPARADHDIVAESKPRQPLVQLLDGHLVIGVEEADDLPARPLHGQPNAAALAAALAAAHDR